MFNVNIFIIESNFRNFDLIANFKNRFIMNYNNYYCKI